MSWPNFRISLEHSERQSIEYFANYYFVSFFPEKLKTVRNLHLVNNLFNAKRNNHLVATRAWLVAYKTYTRLPKILWTIESHSKVSLEEFKQAVIISTFYHIENLSLYRSYRKLGLFSLTAIWKPFRTVDIFTAWSAYKPGNYFLEVRYSHVMSQSPRRIKQPWMHLFSTPILV